MERILGFDIGGTKCAVVLANWDGTELTFLGKVRCETDTTIPPLQMIEKLCDLTEKMDIGVVDRIGISCGGPLDTKQGVILSPPNLPNWNHVPIKAFLEARFHAPAFLQNDANACALAEWKLGAGRESKNMAFLTFGTGLGAGLILNGALYEGTNGNAGELGHIRLRSFGPVGYGKAGSFEGFCSGGGLAQLGWMLATEQVQSGASPTYFQRGMSPTDVTAKAIAEAADTGDATARRVFEICGMQLGVGLSVLIDLLDLERIVIGSIFTRAEHLLRPAMEAVIDKEVLPASKNTCKILPSQLGERIGDYAALCVALVGE